MTTALSFQNTSFNVVQRSGQPWLTSADIATALSYKSIKSITNLYNENKDEFTDCMTLVIESMTNGVNGTKRRMKVRIFSLRGAHLLAMFARTAVAKEFRKWVLDILDREVSQQKQSTTDDRTGLRNAVNLLVSKKGLLYPDAYSFIHQRFNVEHLEQLTKDQLPLAVEYVHRLALEGEYIPANQTLLPGFNNEDQQNSTWVNLNALCRHAEITTELFAQTGLRKFVISLDSSVGRNFIDHVNCLGRLSKMVRSSCQTLIDKAESD